MLIVCIPDLSLFSLTFMNLYFSVIFVLMENDLVFLSIAGAIEL